MRKETQRSNILSRVTKEATELRTKTKARRPKPIFFPLQKDKASETPNWLGGRDLRSNIDA